MRTNSIIDDDLIREGMKFSAIKTKKALIQYALEEYIENHRRKNMADLKGKITFSEEYDHKKLRQNRIS